MVEILESFKAQTENQNYDSLKTDLETEFSLIFKNCTMTGEAHNQLHNFLLPIKDLLGELGGAEMATNEETANKLHTHLKEYPTYFK